MDVLIACEFSARVRDEFRRLGHNAWSVDLQPTEGDPKWHIVGDAVKVAKRPWDLIIAFPPCDRLTTAGARWWPDWQADGSQARAMNFVVSLWKGNSLRIAIENPLGYLNRNWRLPEQVVHPWMYGDPWKKRTCLWLKRLPPLVADWPVEPEGSWTDGGGNRSPDRGAYRLQKERSRTFPGLARAMAEQWGGRR